jgi:hypothetical protein
VPLTSRGLLGGADFDENLKQLFKDTPKGIPRYALHHVERSVRCGKGVVVQSVGGKGVPNFLILGTSVGYADEVTLSPS